MLYGKNGTGKSTLGEALSLLGCDLTQLSSTPSEQLIDTVDLDVEPLFDTRDGSPISENAESLVFNESFIENHVKLRREGLETVALFGEQVQTQQELEQARAGHKLQTSIMENSETEYNEAIQIEENAFLALQKSLKIGWAQRQKTIRGNTVASPVGKDLISKIIGTKVPLDYPTDSISVLTDQISEFLTMSESSAPDRPWGGLLKMDYPQRIDDSILMATLEAPTGSGIAARVSEVLQSFASDVHRARQLFADESISHCPLCLQTTSDQYKQELIEAISSTIDDTAQEFSDELDQAKLPLVELDSSLVDERFRLEKDRFEKARVALNEQIRRWNEACEAKKLSMYSPVEWDSSPFEEKAEEMTASILALEQRANEINEAIKDRSSRQKQLEADNILAARFECDSLVRTLIEAKESLLKNSERCDLERAKLEHLAELEASLSARLMNAQVAVDDINASLRAIFAENDRLVLSLKSTPGDHPKYVLRTRGRAVRPDRLSIGERNIVALAYFFVSVRKRLDELENSASDQWLIIGIDDPVSSMDMDNRLGIHGFLGSQMQRIFTHRHTSVKIILLTHDLSVARELEKASTTALLSAVKTRNEDWAWTFGKVGEQLISRFELNPNHRLVPVAGKLNKKNDYETLINLMWKFAKGVPISDHTLTLTIGNVTRRVVEAFSTFIYNESSIPSQTLSEEYARSTHGAELIVDLGPGHRMFLHEGSHSEDRLTAMSDFGGVVGVDVEEQIFHVRKVLAFMFTLQPCHVTTYLKEDASNATPILEEWCGDLLGHHRAEARNDS
ncbi:MAG: AAA family ATPase [Corynebacterium variabile]|uniref:AAA family ATPase n=1 Tax=Corynebacterium variabile TaxID=1727 RepID=UPI003F9CFC24